MRHLHRRGLAQRILSRQDPGLQSRASRLQPDGNGLLTSNEVSQSIDVIDVAARKSVRDDQDRRRHACMPRPRSGTVAVIDPKTNTAIAAVPVANDRGTWL